MEATPSFDNVPDFGNSATTIKPGDTAYANGYQYLEMLPAEHQNWFLRHFSRNGNIEQGALTSVMEELTSLLSAANLTPDSGSTFQVLSAIKTIAPYTLTITSFIDTTFLGSLTPGKAYLFKASSSAVSAPVADDCYGILFVSPKSASSNIYCSYLAFSTGGLSSPSGSPWIAEFNANSWSGWCSLVTSANTERSLQVTAISSETSAVFLSSLLSNAKKEAVGSVTLTDYPATGTYYYKYQRVNGSYSFVRLITTTLDAGIVEYENKYIAGSWSGWEERSSGITSALTLAYTDSALNLTESRYQTKYDVLTLSGTLTTLNSFVSMGGTSRTLAGLTSDIYGNLYMSVVNDYIYKCPVGSTTFSQFSSFTASWRGMASDPSGNIWACVDSGDIYKCSAGSSTFTAFGAGNKAWRGLTSDPTGNIWGTVTNDDIYKCPVGSTTFTAVGTSGSKLWRYLTSDIYGNIWACVANDGIYKCPSGSTTFTSFYTSSKQWNGMSSDLLGNVYVDEIGGDVYKCAYGATTFVAQGETTRNWSAMASDIFGNVYAAESPGFVYKKATPSLTLYVDNTTGSKNYKLVNKLSRSSNNTTLLIITGSLATNDLHTFVLPVHYSSHIVKNWGVCTINIASDKTITILDEEPLDVWFGYSRYELYARGKCQGVLNKAAVGILANSSSAWTWFLPRLPIIDSNGDNWSFSPSMTMTIQNDGCRIEASNMSSTVFTLVAWNGYSAAQNAIMGGSFTFYWK